MRQKNEIIEEIQKTFQYSCYGIYALYLDEKLVYIGKSRNIARRLAQHIYEIYYEPNQHTKKYRYLRRAIANGSLLSFGIIYKRATPNDEAIGYEEGRFIRHYKPILNTQIPKEDWHKYTVQRLPTYNEFIEIVESMKKSKRKKYSINYSLTMEVNNEREELADMIERLGL